MTDCTGEFERIHRLAAILGPAPQGVTLGIGDDAALIEPPSTGKLVWTVDACVENTHFRRDIASWEDVGFRSFMAAASDLAAMAARPVGALASLTLPQNLPDHALFELAQGQRIAAEKLQTAVIGGNLSKSDLVTISTTLLGVSPHCPRRDGARPGNIVALRGDVGMAAAGLHCLLRDPQWIASNPAEANALAAWRRPLALIEDGLNCSHATSLIDVSDGLVQDAKHIAEASQIRILISTKNLLSSSLQQVAHRLGMNPNVLLLSGGEDYALLGTFTPDTVPKGFIVIGVCEKGEGVWVDGQPSEALGHDHFRS